MTSQLFCSYMCLVTGKSSHYVSLLSWRPPWAWHPRRRAWLALMYLTIGGCATGKKVGECRVEYPEQGKSSYVLPWTVGETYRVVNTNCGRGQTHNGLARFAYDFQMPVGTIIRASR
jgi:hypothetical protein